MPLLGTGCKRDRREPTEARVRPQGVVVDAPGFDDLDGLLQGGEHTLVETLVAQAAVEALDEAILRRLAGRDVVPGDAVLLLPAQHRIRGEIAAVVDDDHRRIAPGCDDAVELADDPRAGERGVRNRGQAFAGEVVDHGQDAEAPAVRQRVGDEVEGPALVRPLRQRFVIRLLRDTAVVFQTNISRYRRTSRVVS